MQSGGEQTGVQTLSWESVILPLPVMGDTEILLTVIAGPDAFRRVAPRRFMKSLERSGAPAGVMRFGVVLFTVDLCTNVSIPRTIDRAPDKR